MLNRKQHAAPIAIQKTFKRQHSALVLFFSAIVLLGIAVYWLYTYLTHGANINAYFLKDHYDTSMDYFNMLSNMSHSDPYYQDANYPALPFLIWRIMYGFLPPDGEYAVGYYLRTDMQAQLGYIFFLLVGTVMIWELIKKLAKGKALTKILFALALLFSGPMFFLLERGNILLWSLSFLLLFLAFYDAPRLSLRMVGYIGLAVSAGIKIYPAIFGLMLVKKKRYKEAIYLSILGAITFFAPFFAFDGIASVLAMVKGFSVSTSLQSGEGLGSNYSFGNLIQLGATLFGVNLTEAPFWGIFLAGCLYLVLFAISRQEWEALFALSILCLGIPSFSYPYALVVLFLPIISFFFRCENQGRFKKIYMILFALTIIPYGLPIMDSLNEVVHPDYLRWPITGGQITISVALLLITSLIIIDRILPQKVGKKQQIANSENVFTVQIHTVEE